MSNNTGATEARTISDFERQMREGVDKVFSSDGSLVSVFEAILPEIEQFIGKEETLRMILEATAKDDFSIFTISQLVYVGVLVERLSKSLKALSDAHGQWNILLGRIYSEIDAYYDIVKDKEDE